jgi:hypothetical protein
MAYWTLGSLLASACGGSSFAAAPADAGPDAAIDAGGTPEAGGVGDTGSGPPPASWCSTQKVLFCADFDESSDVMATLKPWTTSAQVGGTFSLVQSSDNPSPPNALAVAGSGPSSNAIVVQAFPSLPTKYSRLRLEFDFRVNQAPKVGLLAAGAFAAIAYDPGDVTNTSVALGVGYGSTVAVAYTEPGTVPGLRAATAPFPMAGVWAGRFALEIDYGAVAAVDGGSGACAQLYEGGAAVLPSCLALPAAFARPKSVAIALGFFSIGAASDGQLEFDNVTFNVSP